MPISFSHLGPHELKVGSLIPSKVKLMTYKIGICHFLAWHSALIGYDMDWLAQCQDNVTESVSGISGHGTGSLIFEWGSTIKAA